VFSLLGQYRHIAKNSPVARYPSSRHSACPEKPSIIEIGVEPLGPKNMDVENNNMETHFFQCQQFRKQTFQVPDIGTIISGILTYIHPIMI
jgi:hypothetical protein